MSFNLASIIREAATRYPDHPAVAYDGGTLTYAELDHESDLVARNLVRLGLKTGDPVGLQLPNVPAFVIALHGVLKAGGSIIPMNVLNKAAEIEYFLSFAKAFAIVSDASVADEAIKGAAAAGVSHVFIRGERDGSDVPEGATSFWDLINDPGESSPAPFATPSPNDTAVLLYTSGTTGKPKGVQLTHFQLYMNSKAHVDAFAMDHTTSVVAVMPLFHALGLSGILNATAIACGTVRLLSKFDPTRVLEVVDQEKATMLHGVPTMYHALLNHPDRDTYDTSSLRICGSAGAAIAAELLDSIEKTFGIQIIEMYGLTESGPLATNNLPNDRKPYSIGKPIWGTEVQIWSDEGEELPRGKEHVGEIVIRGHNTMSGYLNNPDATKEAFKGGWLHSGDLGYKDEDGFLFIVDRKKEMIIRGGYNVYPREVEEVLYQHPAVFECAVIGVPNERLGEEVAAYISIRPGHELTEEEVIEFTKERLAAYKFPRTVTFLNELPHGPTGKILKRMLLED